MDKSFPTTAGKSFDRELPRRTLRGGLARPISRRLSIWVITTIAIQFALLIAYPAIICGCCFHPEAFWISLLPIGWGVYCFTFYKTKPERVVSYVGLALAIAWAWIAWDSNIVFSFK